MIHTGSRGLGHQVCTDHLAASDRAMRRAGIRLVDRQLACMPLQSEEGKDYLAAMAAAANFAFCNRRVRMVVRFSGRHLPALQWQLRGGVAGSDCLQPNA